MLINCICGQKTFEVDDYEIPIEGRQVKCGLCSKEWFYKLDEIKLETNKANLGETIKDDNVPIFAEEIISQAEQSQRDTDSKSERFLQTKSINNKIFQNQENVDKKHIRNIKFFIYLIIIGFLGSVFLVPYKQEIMIKFPYMTNWLNIFTPVYEYINILYFNLLKQIF